MALCDGCKKDLHEQHRARSSVKIRRKGIDVEGVTHEIECTCVICTRKGDWRGDSETLPKTPSYRFGLPWIQPNPRSQKRKDYRAAKDAVARIKQA